MSLKITVFRFVVVFIVSLILLFGERVFITSADIKLKSAKPIKNKISNSLLPDYSIQSGKRISSLRKNEEEILNLENNLVVKASAKNSIKLEWNENLDLPQSIFSYGNALTSATSDDVVVIAKRFLRDNKELFKISDTQLENTRISALDKNKAETFTRLVLEQQIQGIRVVGSEMLFVIDGKGRLLSQSGSFIPEVEKLAFRVNPLISAEMALSLAAEECGKKLTMAVTSKLDNSVARKRTVFSSDEVKDQSEASLVYFPISKQEVRLAYQVLLYGVPRFMDAYKVVIDAETGKLLERAYLTKAFTSSFGRVFTKESPLLGNRELVSFNGDLEASKAGWVNDNKLEGNNTVVVSAPDYKNLREMPKLSDGEIFKAKEDGNFDFPVDLNNQPINSVQASATNLFYWVNFAHDRFYKLGFDESSRNFQIDNFSRGGKDKDYVQAYSLLGANSEEVRNNAFFTPTLEGEAPTLAMLMFEKRNAEKITNLDSCYDAGVIIHEFTHGVSTRLAGTDNELGLNFSSSGLGEGWSDFFALSFLSEEKIVFDSVVPVGTYLADPISGIRSFPYSTLLDVNPLTFGDIKYDSEPHAQGTVWCTILWDIRQSLIKKYGFDKGREVAEQLVVNGLKMVPLNPSFIDARNGILAADKATNDGLNQELLWNVFARRGLGASASVTIQGVREDGFFMKAVEGFDLPVEISSGSLVVNEKSPIIAVFDETLPLIVVDRDLLSLPSINITVTNERTNKITKLELKQDKPGRFVGNFKPVRNLINNKKQINKPGDIISITYENAHNDLDSSKIINVKAILGQRIEVYKQDFESEHNFQFPKAFEWAENYWHITKLRSVSPNKSLAFVKESNEEAFTPEDGYGAAILPKIDMRNRFKPSIELNYFFSGFQGVPEYGFSFPDWIALEGTAKKNDYAALTINYGVLPKLNTDFEKLSIDIRYLEKNEAVLSFWFGTSIATEVEKIDRKQFKGAYIDDIRVTAVTTQ